MLEKVSSPIHRSSNHKRFKDVENKEGQDRNQGDRRSRGPLHEHSRRKEVVKMRRGRRKW